MMEWTDTTIPAVMVEPRGFTDHNGQSNGRPALMITTTVGVTGPNVSSADDGVIIEGTRSALLEWLAEATEAVLAQTREQAS